MSSQIAFSDSIKLVVFGLSTEEFGIEITKINAIIRIENVTEIPYAADFIEGIINYRGRPLVVIDLRKRFGLPEFHSKEEDKRIIVLDFNPFLVGMIVDNVSEVLSIPLTQIEPVPENLISLDIEQEYLLGVGNINKGERLIILLDLSKVFSDGELEELGVLFNQEEEIRTYLIENQKMQVKENENLRIAQAKKNLIDSTESEDRLYRDAELSNEEYEEMERQMIRKLALRDIQQEFGIDLEDSVKEEVIYINDVSTLEKDEDTEYVYVDENGRELSEQEIQELLQEGSEELEEITSSESEEKSNKNQQTNKKNLTETSANNMDPEVAELIAAAQADIDDKDNNISNHGMENEADRIVSNDEVADLIAAVQSKKANKSSNSLNQNQEKLVEELVPEMIETYRKHLGYNTKAELVELAEKYPDFKLDMKMLKREMLDALVDYFAEFHPEMIMNYSEEN